MPTLGDAPSVDRTVHADVVDGAEDGPIPAPGPGHVALLLEARALEQGQIMKESSVPSMPH